MRAELRLRVVAVATPTRLTLTALVGKPPWPSGARIAQSWLIIEVGTNANYVGFGSSSGRN